MDLRGDIIFDLRRVDSWNRYYKHIKECFEVFRSLSALPETLFPLTLSFLVQGDTPAWIACHKSVALAWCNLKVSL